MWRLLAIVSVLTSAISSTAYSQSILSTVNGSLTAFAGPKSAVWDGVDLAYPLPLSEMDIGETLVFNPPLIRNLQNNKTTSLLHLKIGTESSPSFGSSIPEQALITGGAVDQMVGQAHESWTAIPNFTAVSNDFKGYRIHRLDLIVNDFDNATHSDPWSFDYTLNIIGEYVPGIPEPSAAM